MSRVITERIDRSDSFGDPSDECQHRDVHEIGCDFDKGGMLLRLVRCQKCGLLMRQYLPMVR